MTQIHSRSKLIKLLTELKEQNSDNPNLLLLALSPFILLTFASLLISLPYYFLLLPSLSDKALFLILEHEGVDLTLEEFITDFYVPYFNSVYEPGLFTMGCGIIGFSEEVDENDIS